MKDHRLLRVGATIFRVFAWVTLILQCAIGLYLLVAGGEAVLVAGIDVPARLVGVLNCLGGLIYFFLLSLAAAVIRLLLEIAGEPKGGASGA